MGKTIILCVLISYSLFAQEISSLKVVAVGIGAKNPTFVEKKFPHIEFYYTPELISKAELSETGKSALALLAEDATREVFEGKPELLSKWWDERDLRFYSTLFDKNGVGAWQGKLNRSDDLMAINGKGVESGFEDALEYLIEDGKVAEFDSDKKFNYEAFDCLIETKMPDFEIISVDGVKKSIKSVVENGNTTLLVFFQIPSSVDLNAAKKEVKEESGFGGFLSAMTQSAAGSHWESTFINIESIIFEHKVTE